MSSLSVQRNYRTYLFLWKCHTVFRTFLTSIQYCSHSRLTSGVFLPNPCYVYLDRKTPSAFFLPQNEKGFFCTTRWFFLTGCEAGEYLQPHGQRHASPGHLHQEPSPSPASCQSFLPNLYFPWESMPHLLSFFNAWCRFVLQKWPQYLYCTSQNRYCAKRTVKGLSHDMDFAFTWTMGRRWF